MSDAQQESGKLKISLSDAILVLVLTAVAYGITYYYEVGFKSFYGITDIMIEVNTQKILLSVSGVITKVTIMFFTLNFFTEHHPKLYPLKMFLWINLYFIFLLFLVGLNVYFILGIIFLEIPISCYLFVWPLMKYRQIRGYKNKLEELKNTIQNKNDLVEKIINKYGNIPIILVVVITFMPLVKYTGQSEASSKIRYLVVEYSTEKYVAIDNYNGKFIIAPIDLKKKEITPKYQIVELLSSADKKIQCEYMDIGPLTVKNIP